MSLGPFRVALMETGALEEQQPGKEMESQVRAWPHGTLGWCGWMWGFEAVEWVGVRPRGSHQRCHLPAAQPWQVLSSLHQFLAGGWRVQKPPQSCCEWAL